MCLALGYDMGIYQWRRCRDYSPIFWPLKHNWHASLQVKSACSRHSQRTFLSLILSSQSCKLLPPWLAKAYSLPGFQYPWLAPQLCLPKFPYFLFCLISLELQSPLIVALFVICSESNPQQSSLQKRENEQWLFIAQKEEKELILAIIMQ